MVPPPAAAKAAGCIGLWWVSLPLSQLIRRLAMCHSLGNPPSSERICGLPLMHSCRTQLTLVAASVCCPTVSSFILRCLALFDEPFLVLLGVFANMPPWFVLDVVPWVFVKYAPALGCRSGGGLHPASLAIGSFPGHRAYRRAPRP